MSISKTVQIEYAHCVKFTPGQLDRFPFSEYQKRVQPAKLQRCQDFDSGPEFRVGLDGWIVGHGSTESEAIADAAYVLMDKSRARCCLSARIS